MQMRKKIKADHGGQPMTIQNILLSQRHALWLRLGVGLVFGLLIATLIETDKSGVGGADQWRATLASALGLSAFVLWAGAAAMRRVTLAVWFLVAFGLVYYISDATFDTDSSRNGPFWSSYFLLYPLLFIAHELVSSGDQAGRLIAPYETYFDEAWKRGVQLILAIIFVLLFWGILWLGAALLGFIGFDWLEELLKEPYFHWPASGLAFGAAVHLGDVQSKILANVRNLVLGVMSWLLPIIAVIGAIFALSLLRSGLKPLWDTNAATASLLAGCVGFVLLINAAYQQGDNERPVSIILKWCVRIAAVLLLVFSVLAAWSLWLRIDQYGLSADRILAGIGVIIAVSFGIGYSIAAIWPGRWMARVEPVNIGMAILKVAIFFAVLTPIADPARLSVADQVARLNAGKVSVADFDWWLLKDETGHYGKRALEALAKSDKRDIAAKAQAALKNDLGERPYREFSLPVEANPLPRDLSKLKVVVPKGGSLPSSFLTGGSANVLPEYCFKSPQPTDNSLSCSVALLDLNGDQQNEVLIRSGFELRTFSFINGSWNLLQTTNFGPSFSFDDFDAGRVQVRDSVWKDIIITSPIGGMSVYRSQPDPNLVIQSPPPPSK
jgi:hypothetical protein